MVRRRSLGEADYRVQHTAPGREAAPLFDLTGNGVYPCDVYTQPRHYMGSHDADAESWRVIAARRCKPNARVTIYRAVPPGVTTINPGDWVAVAKSYAKDHAYDLLGPGRHGKVISMSVRAKDIFTDGNSLSEWGYDPE